MPSFDLSYDADDDVLEVTFDVYDERFAHTIALNDHIIVFTDTGLQAVWGLSFYSYARLLMVSETEFTGLRDLDEAHVNAILALLTTGSAGLFFDLTDPVGLIARVQSPRLDALVQDAEA